MKEREFVTDYFVEKLNSIIDEEFWDFQCEHDVEDGGLPPELELGLVQSVNALLDSINECIGWQADHAFDMTV